MACTWLLRKFFSLSLTMILFLHVGIFVNVYELWICWTQVIAVVSAILTRGQLDMDLKIRALRILPMFLWPGLSFVSYSAYRKFTDMRKYHITYTMWLLCLISYIWTECFSFWFSIVVVSNQFCMCSKYIVLYSVRSSEFFISVFCHIVWEDSAVSSIN